MQKPPFDRQFKTLPNRDPKKQILRKNRRSTTVREERIYRYKQ